MSDDRLNGETGATQAFAARIGRYELQATIGRGGMGTVYKAHDPEIDRLVAIKAVSISDPNLRTRFRQEVRIAGLLNHPHIVIVYDVGVVEDLAYIVMELVEGQTLADLLPSRLSWTEAVKLSLPICEALDYAHQQGVIHRDVKPANVLLAADGRVKLTDFGIARLEASLRLTQTGSVLGTPLYMSPEQWEGGTVDRRVDIFSLGVILFELIAGQNPFAGDETAPHRVVLSPNKPPDFDLLEDVAPHDLRDIIQRAMAEDPDTRFASAADMADALTVCLEGDTRQVTPSLDIPPAPVVSAPSISIEISSGLDLSSTERGLLAGAFGDHDRVYVENELSDPAGDARLLVTLPVRGGNPLARVIAKLASPEILSREWRAYKEYVADILPLVTAHIQGAPLLSPDRKLALLRYTFAGDVGEQRAENLMTYYQSQEGAEVAGLLEQNILRVLAPYWWLNRDADMFLLRREYDRLLPVHLVVERAAQAKASPHVFQAGGVAAQDVRHLNPGQPVQLQGFRVATVQRKLGAMTLTAPVPTGSDLEQLRIQLTGLSPDTLRYQPGDLVPNFAGTVASTRYHLLSRVAQATFPTVDLTGPSIHLGRHRLPNPLSEYEGLLERHVSGMISIIHGDLRLESILVEPGSGLTWLINFAETCPGHNLYDFLQLETQIVTRLLPPSETEAETGLEDEIIAMARSLHCQEPPPHAPHPALQKPYELLRTIRHRANHCMLDSANWDEYHLGLVMMLLGALPSTSKSPQAGRLTLIWAAVACERIGQQVVSFKQKKGRPLARFIGLALILVAVAVSLAILFGNSFLSPAQPTTEAPVAVAAITPSPSPSGTYTPTLPLTQTPSPEPRPTVPLPGVLMGGLNIHNGPGENYPIIGTAYGGTSVQVTGRNRRGDWWQIADPSAPGGYGWVQAQFIEVKGESTPVLPIAEASPPPTVTRTPTNTPTSTSSPPITSTSVRVPANTPFPTATPPPPTPTPLGTPTAAANAPRTSAYDMPGFQQLSWQLAHPPVSASFSPFGQEIAVTEGIKLYTVSRDGTSGHIWMEEDETIRPIGGALWSPDGLYIVFMADRKRDCNPCRVVGLVRVTDGWLHYLEAPAGQATDLPRWTQDGELMVTVHAGDPSSGATYVYGFSSQAYARSSPGQVASGEYVLSSSHEGQKWSPWQPGKPWQVGSGGPDGYYGD